MEPRTGGAQSGDALIHRTQGRLQRHLDRIADTLGIDRIDAETLTARTLADLEEQVQDYVGRLDARRQLRESDADGNRGDRRYRQRIGQHPCR